MNNRFSKIAMITALLGTLAHMNPNSELYTKAQEMWTKFSGLNLDLQNTIDQVIGLVVKSQQSEEKSNGQ